jgi:Tfp pilus assembly protein PilV
MRTRRSSAASAALRRARAADGLSLVEVLIAALVLTVGLIGLIGAFDAGRKLTLLSERRTAMAHRAQLEIEKLQSYPYSELAMASAPTHSSETINPDYYVNLSSPANCTSAGDGCYAWNAESSGEEEALVPATSGECTSPATSGCGLVAASPSGRSCSSHVGACEWADGQVGGYVYEFVTWHNDKTTKENYKRITVVVTAKVPKNNHEPQPVRISTLVAEPGP